MNCRVFGILVFTLTTKSPQHKSTLDSVDNDFNQWTDTGDDKEVGIIGRNHSEPVLIEVLKDGNFLNIYEVDEF